MQEVVVANLSPIVDYVASPDVLDRIRGLEVIKYPGCVRRHVLHRLISSIEEALLLLFA